MKYPGIISAGILLAVIQGVAWAQIYETKDEQGNPVFSDEPVDNSSSVIEVTETNIADSPAQTPEVETTPATDSGSQNAKRTDGGPVYKDPQSSIWEERVRRQQAFEKAKSTSTPHEVLDAEPRREVLDAEPRREVMDAEPRREVGDF